MAMKTQRYKKLLLICAIVIVLAVGAWAVIYYHVGNIRIGGSDGGQTASYQTPEEASSVYVRFDMEGYDTIKANYWAASSTYDLPKVFQASLAKVLNTSGASNSNAALPVLPSDDRAGTAAMLASVIATSSTPAAQDFDKQLAVATLQVVLYNLQPAGRSSLASSQQVTALRQEVSNVNPTADLYGDLGAATSSSAAALKQSYDQKMATLAHATSSADLAKAKQVAYAYKVLSDQNTRALYTSSGIQPTASNSILGNTLYVRLSKMAPTVVQEFAWDVDAASTTSGLDSLIIDLRGNIGGSTAVAQGFMGLFLGPNQYAFDLFHQGDYQVQRTLLGKFPELDRYHEIAVLTDNMTQSTAEVLTEALSHFNLAHSVGATTRGWGTVEDTYPLKTAIDPVVSYALILVNSVTLRSDGQPIESRGVTPDVDVSAKGWQARLSSYFRSPGLIQAIESSLAKPAGK